MNKRAFVTGGVLAAAIALAGCQTTGNQETAATTAAKKAELNTQVDGTFARLYAQTPSARELVDKSYAQLVFPSVVSGGFIVGGEYGQGELRQGGKTLDYYKITSVTAGLLAGAQSQAVIFLFMTQAAFDQFRASNGWTAGVDASVAMVNKGADASIDTNTAKQPVVGFVLTNSGLMANASVSGTKISRLEM